MATVVDSKEKPLSAPTIISMSVGGGTLREGVTPQSALISISKELTMESADVLQVGNTVFLAHRGKDKNKNKLHGRAFNVDTARNFVANTIKYLKLLQNKGVTHYSVDFDTGTIEPAVRAIGKAFRDTGVEGYMMKGQKGKLIRVLVKFPEKVA
jgi:hypothetical protein